MKKRGLSPVIASVLLVMIVVVLAAIIFIWARGFVKEGVGKFGQPADRACDKITFEADIFPSGGGYTLDVNNQGEVPLYGFDLKKFGKGEVIVTQYVSQDASISGNTVGTGQSSSFDLGSSQDFASGNEVLIVPIILGETNAGKVSYTCADQYGVGVTI